MARSTLISVVVPVLDEAACLPRLHQDLRSVCDCLSDQFEFVFVDDGSSDHTEQVLAELRRTDDRVSYLSLSRNFGHQYALSAGLAHASGDAVIMMDGDLQHPPRLIPQLLERWRAGYDLVETVRLQTDDIALSKRFFSCWFYRVFNWLASIRLTPGNADFRLMSRRAVDVLNVMPERHRFLRGLIPWLGFPQTHVEFSAPARWAGRSKYTFLRNIRFALDGLTAFNFCPLRWLAMRGGLVILVSLGLGLFALAKLAAGGSTAGWCALFSLVAFLGGTQLIALGILGDYVGRTLEQVKGRPLYIVRASAGFSLSRPGDRAVPAPHIAVSEMGAGEAPGRQTPEQQTLDDQRRSVDARVRRS
jgi:dolichol-phosphate mannosyltransferase